MSFPTPTIPIISDDDDDENEEFIRPKDWLFSTDFILLRFMRVH